MSKSVSRGGGFTEDCLACGGDTDHTVTIELRTESTKRENAAYSREPYRVATCNRCGETTAIRMNNA